jgi:hypothetical protein
MWAQLAPFSHASDVAMGVLLPLLLVAAFSYLAAEHRRDLFAFGAVAITMVLAVTTAHIREIIQFVVYLAGFLGVLVLIDRDRSMLTRSAFLLAASLTVVGAYMVYHRTMVGHVTAIVSINREHLLAMWRAMRPEDYVRQPLNDGHFVNNFHLWYYNLNPVVLLGAPLVFVAFRRRLLMFVWAGLFAYLLIVRFPILSIAYLVATYFEMLSAPVRNVSFFLYILAGALVYLAASLAGRLRPMPLWLMAVAALAGLAFVLGRTVPLLHEVLPRHPDVVFAGGLVGLPLALWLGATKWGGAFARANHESAAPVRLRIGAAVLIAALGVALHQPAAALTAPAPNATNLRQAIELAGSPVIGVVYPTPDEGKVLKDKGTNDVPPPELVRWMTVHVPVEAILAVNLFNANILTTYVPQRAPAWPIGYHDPINYCVNFKRYCGAANQSVVRYGVQPFFNDVESRDERLAFLKDFNITYVVVDPPFDATMKRVLGQYPDQFTEVYTADRWRVFKVTL